MSSFNRLRLLRLSRRAEEVTVHEDGRLQARAAELDPVTAERTNVAANIVEEARQRGGELLRHSAEQATAVQHAAYREGHEQGYRDGTAAARADVLEVLELVQLAARDAKVLRDRVLAGAEPEIVEIVIASVRTILGAQVQLDRTLVFDTVERALRRAGAQNVVRIRVDPEDRELVGAQLAERLGEAAAAWEVTADGTVGVGGCVIDTEHGEVDARLDVQLDEIARTFRALHEEGAAEEARADAA